MCTNRDKNSVQFRMVPLSTGNTLGQIAGEKAGIFKVFDSLNFIFTEQYLRCATDQVVLCIIVSFSLAFCLKARCTSIYRASARRSNVCAQGNRFSFGRKFAQPLSFARQIVPLIVE